MMISGQAKKEELLKIQILLEDVLQQLSTHKFISTAKM
jgi:hypothetical protein